MVLTRVRRLEGSRDRSPCCGSRGRSPCCGSHGRSLDPEGFEVLLDLERGFLYLGDGLGHCHRSEVFDGLDVDLARCLGTRGGDLGCSLYLGHTNLIAVLRCYLRQQTVVLIEAVVGYVVMLLWLVLLPGR